MKKVILLLCMAVSCTYAQDKDKDNYFSGSFGFDIKNGFVGSKPTNNERALNWTGEVHAVSDDFDFGLGYESFSEISYDRKFMGMGYHFPIAYITGTDIRFSIQPSVEMSWIGREWTSEYGQEERTFFTPSLNVNFNWDLGKYVAVQVASNWLPRPDVRVIYHQQHNKYVLSNGLKVVIKIPHN